MPYSKLSQESGDSEEDVPLVIPITRSPHRPSRLMIWVFIAILCGSNFVTYYVTRQQERTKCGTSNCLIGNGELGDRLPVDLYETQRDDILIPDPAVARHIYRLPPSPEVDAAWKTLSHNGHIIVSEEEVRRAGKDPEMVLKVPTELGYGENKYAAYIDGVHQVHCLDLLRKNLFTNYEYYYGRHYNFTPPIFHELHLNHCLDTLLQDLMCTADSHITFFNYVEGQDGVQPDFAVNRVCRNYTQMVEWFDSHRIKNWESAADKIKWKPGQKRRPEFAGWKKYVDSRLSGYDGETALGRLDESMLPPSCVQHGDSVH